MSARTEQSPLLAPQRHVAVADRAEEHGSILIAGGRGCSLYWCLRTDHPGMLIEAGLPPAYARSPKSRDVKGEATSGDGQRTGKSPSARGRPPPPALSITIRNRRQPRRPTQARPFKPRHRLPSE